MSQQKTEITKDGLHIIKPDIAKVFPSLLAINHLVALGESRDSELFSQFAELLQQIKHKAISMHEAENDWQTLMLDAIAMLMDLAFPSFNIAQRNYLINTALSTK